MSSADRPSLATLSVELRILILCQVADLETLRSLIQSCAAFYQAYSAAQKEVTLALARHLFEMDGVGLQEPLRAIRAPRVETKYDEEDLERAKYIAYPTPKKKCDEQQLKGIQHFLDQHSKEHPIRQQELIDLSIEEVRQLIQIHRVATYLSRDLMKTMISRHPVTGLLEGEIAEPSMEERRRLTTSIYQWELWKRLFGPRFGSDPEFDGALSGGADDVHVSLYLNRFEPWEVEALACTRDYALITYSNLFAQALERAPPEPEDAVLPLRYNLSPDGTAYNASLEYMVSVGPRILYKILNTQDPEEKYSFAHKISSWWPTFGKIIGQAWLNRRYRLNNEPCHDDPTDPNLVPPGWNWASAGRTNAVAVRGGIRPRHVPCAEEYEPLRFWGYIFWDSHRLAGWGLDVDGGGKYCWEMDDYCWIDSFFYERNTNKRVDRRPSAMIEKTWQ